MTTRKGSKRPFILVSVSGGVASAYVPRGISWDIVDWDDWDGEVPTPEDIRRLRRIAERLPTAGDRKQFNHMVDELEDRMNSAELQAMTEIEMDDKAERQARGGRARGGRA